MRLACSLIVLLALYPGRAQAQAPRGAAPVLLVSNRNSPESGQIADYYARRRGVPAAQRCAIAAGAGETITREQYVREVESPVGACLDRLPAGLIHYIVLTQGTPLRVRGAFGRNGTAASVDSELAALRMKRLNSPVTLDGPARNPYYHQNYSRFDPRAFPIYMVARLAAYDVKTVFRMIDDSIAAENLGLFVLDMKEKGALNEGDRWIERAALLLPRSRVKVEVSAEPLYNAESVLGYCGWGSNDPNRLRRKLGFRWRPGSIATEYVSSNGRTLARPPDSWRFGQWTAAATYHAGSPQSLSADYLEEGASAATGHTWEPYLAYTPHPDLLFPAYHGGRTLGESYYISIPAVSWMNVLFGDPLTTLGPPKN